MSAMLSDEFNHALSMVDEAILDQNIPLALQRARAIEDTRFLSFLELSRLRRRQGMTRLIGNNYSEALPAFEAAVDAAVIANDEAARDRLCCDMAVTFFYRSLSLRTSSTHHVRETITEARTMLELGNRFSIRNQQETVEWWSSASISAHIDASYSPFTNPQALAKMLEAAVQLHELKAHAAAYCALIRFTSMVPPYRRILYVGMMAEFSADLLGTYPGRFMKLMGALLKGDKNVGLAIQLAED